MLSDENNRLLCAVGPGTPAGELFRSIWLPALLSAQLPEAACPPVRLKLLGEELVAIRDGEGNAGIIQAHCAHRRAPLFFGKMEPEGIRCAYHGWLYDRLGQCLEVPNHGDPEFCQKVKIKSYNVAEKAGVVWIYMGEREPPELPQFLWCAVPDEHRLASVWLQETNWFQGVEGEIDSSHVSSLHKSKMTQTSTRVHRHFTALDPNPRLFVEATDIGFMSIARRKAEEKFYWRATQWMMPMFSFIPSAAWPIGGRAWVPIDDENSYTWDFNYDPDHPLTERFYEFVRAGGSFPPEMEYRPYQLNTGAIIDTYIPKRNKENDYLIDREKQKNFSTTGIHGVNDQDRAMQEGMGRIPDRAKEMLVPADRAIVTARRRVLDVLQSPEELERFRQTVQDGSVFALSPIDVVSKEEELEDFLDGYARHTAAA